MFQIIKDIIAYNGQNNIDSTIISTCQVLIPVLVVYFIWCFTKIISYICNFGKK